MPQVTIAAAAILAVFTPLTIILVRHEIRLRRIRLIDAFSQNFGTSDRQDPPPEPPAPVPADSEKVVGLHGTPEDPPATPTPHRPRTIRSTPSFEYVLSKYAVDIDSCPKGIDRRKLRALDLSDQAVDCYVSGLRWYQLRSNWRILSASLPYMLCCFFGFLITFWPLTEDGMQSLQAVVAPVFPTNGGLADAAGSEAYERHFRNVLTIAAVSFIGAYLFTLRTFVRAVTVFDLSAITMLRATVHVLLSVATVVMIYRALPTTSTLLALNPFGSAAAEGESAAPIGAFWYIAAFLFGFFPDSALRFMLAKATQVTRSIKTIDDRFGDQTRSIPLDMIDGIDFATRYRLEEANIFEVQNLACANPIMLHIETPYGIYETIDWVAQAQLCTVVGPERFLVMRQFHIRTIFDLERAVLSGQSTPELRRFVALLLLMPTEVARTLVSTILKTSFPDMSRRPPTMLKFEDLSVAAAALFSPPDPPPPAGPAADATLEHLVRIIVDDLHIHRLRQIWMVISIKLGRRAASLSAMEEPDFYPHAA